LEEAGQNTHGWKLKLFGQGCYENEALALNQP